MTEAPTGTIVTFLFTDIEGSTRLLKAVREQWGEVLAEHQQILRAAFAEHGGHEVDTQGDAFFAAFPSARGAVLAAVDAQRALAEHEWPDGLELRVRMGIHTGQASLSGGRYVGLGVHRAARIAAAAHGGQVLLSQATVNLLEDEEQPLPDIRLRSLGDQRLKDLDRPVRLYRVDSPGLVTRRRRPRTVSAARRRGAVAALIGAMISAAVAATLLLTSRGGDSVTVPPNSLALIDAKAGRVVAYTPVGTQPASVAVGAGALWVANVDDRTLSRIDPEMHRVTRTIPLHATPTAVAYGAGAVWVANGLLGSVTRVDPSYDAPVATVAARITAVSRSSAGSVAVGFGSVWAVFQNSVLLRINPKTNRLAAIGYAGSGSRAIVAGRDAVWVANAGDNSLSRIDPDTVSPVVPVTVPRGPAGVAVGGGAVWATSSTDDRVTRIDEASNAVTDTIRVGESPQGIAYGAGSVWVANSDDGTVSRIDATARRVTRTISVGNRPVAVAVSRGRVWVTVEAP